MTDHQNPGPLRLGIAGLGTVGTGVVKIIQRHTALLAARTGREIVISAVSSFEIGQFSLAVLAASSNCSLVAPGILAVTSRCTLGI